MKKFVVLYMGPKAAQQQLLESTPEAAQEGLKAWLQWADRVGDGIVDIGTPLLAGREITAAGISDTETEVGGYAIIQAEDLDSAQALFEGHPHLLMPGCRIEVYESLDMPGM
ncbi:hypothetical protein [Arthrobacter sp. BE255]|uniref:hypothetical protein n=1 Tax=Arthrobacter sp. BE255 TaxID=2817721 RepID=UPI0028664D44|nr:hypothetical protein [Arthrobacter sp. BE255]MDR7159530.1 hypothetical protein [Arthrobacter sp. BE255]